MPKGKSETMRLGHPGIPKGFKTGLFHLKEGQSEIWTCSAEDGSFARDIDLEDHGKKFKIPAKTQLNFKVDL
ncbi:hypothetical protein M407DRAFT_25013 [Tulasnella calospora MUT 4182]|uniref:Uncharacterized protein n=1 Tax=Tulasnella calospora MUT 4182 TaxID=1051891 RepID=A0A0C3QGT6_9AGAM|nr:hypothetical protein M407DRAFT_25013 [Tulasnella calospora MUT 4182]